MRILHIGNIAMNAYNNAKFLRRKGIEADVLVIDYSYIMGQPEWEDALFDEEIKDEWNPKWDKINIKNGFRRPEWFKEYSTGIYQSKINFIINLYWRIKNFFWFFLNIKKAFEIKKTLDRESLEYSKINNNNEFTNKKIKSKFSKKIKIIISFLKAITIFREKYEHIKILRRVVDKYDIIQAYGLDPIFVILANVKKPLISFEHGTMRSIPLENSLRGQLLRAAYKKSEKCIITNPDSKITADKLGLKNYVFIPHPIDLEKFSPRKTTIRKKILKESGAKFIFFAPARQDWEVKGNQKIIEAFHKYINRITFPTVIIFSNWGVDTVKSKKYIKELGLENYIRWIPPLPKIKLSEYFNASDLVIDQFCYDVFGSTTPEAMACAKPVITRFDWEVNKVAWPEPPPIISAKTPEEIFRAMKKIVLDNNLRQNLGKMGRLWMEKYHSPEVVTDKLCAIYEEVLRNK